MIQCSVFVQIHKKSRWELDTSEDHLGKDDCITGKPHLSGPNLSGHVLEPIMILYRESDSFSWIFSYPDNQLGNGGVRISEVPLYWESNYS